MPSRSNLFLCSMLLSCIPASAQMRVASLNLARKCGPPVIAEIEKQPGIRKADVLLLQEVVDGPSCHMASDVGAALGLNVIFAPAFLLNQKFQEGLAILSRYPIGGKRVIPLSHNDLFFHTRIRIVLAATVESPSGPVRVVNTHLDNRINANAKRDQLTGIWHETDHFHGPCIAGGDFNTGNFRWVSNLLPLPGIQSLRDMVNNEMQQHGFSTPLGSGPGTLHFMGLKLDWIYLRGLQASDSGVTPIRFSDHNSVWVSIQGREPDQTHPK